MRRFAAGVMTMVVVGCVPAATTSPTAVTTAGPTRTLTASTSRPATGPSTAPSTVAGTDAPSAWVRHLPAGLREFAGARAIVLSPETIIATGSGANGSGDWSHTTWTSVDGVAWETIEELDGADIAAFLGPGLAIGADHGPAAVAAPNARLASWTSPTSRPPIAASSCEAGPPTDAATWTRGADGHWQRRPQEPAFDGFPMLAGVSAEGSGGFIVGSDELGQPDGIARSAAWWFKDDGFTRYSSAALDAGLLRDVAVAFDRQIGVGVLAECYGRGGPMMWDGPLNATGPWRTADPPDGAAALAHIVAAPLGSSGETTAVVAGVDDTGRAALWASNDGIDWERADFDAEAPAPVLAAVPAATPWIVAAGRAGVWGSRDGRHWQRLAGGGDWLTALAADDARVVAIGMDGSLSVPVVWTGPATSP